MASNIDINHFGSVAVEVLAPVAYAAFHLAQDDPMVSAELHRAFERAARKRCRGDFVSQALSGMPDAVLPFYRPTIDILYTAACASRVGRVRLAGLGNAVEAGFFEVSETECRYNDCVKPYPSTMYEVLRPGHVPALCQRLTSWQQRPQVQVGDLALGELLRLTPGTNGFKSLSTMPPANPRLQQLGVKSVLSILRVEQGETQSHLPPPMRVERLCQGEAQFEREENTLVLRNPRPELVMEMHAAWINEEDPSELWLHVRRHGEQFLAPLPDLMTTGSASQGWWTPTRDLYEALGAGPDPDAVHITRRAATRLMQRFPWFGVSKPNEWATCAWWYREALAHSLNGSPTADSSVSVSVPLPT
ncbi:MAG: hypothetical protein EBT96_12935 [Betaproteobacteria bacterium]|nr:hypothetical protein [Betaproteobacteria bacterium]